MRPFFRSLLVLTALSAAVAPCHSLYAQMPDLPTTTPTKALAESEGRTSPAWLDSAVIYEIFPRSFSPKGDLNGVTARLDDLQKLGVSVLWLMPLHPVGQVKKKGSEGSPYAVQDP